MRSYLAKTGEGVVFGHSCYLVLQGDAEKGRPQFSVKVCLSHRSPSAVPVIRLMKTQRNDMSRASFNDTTDSVSVLNH